MGRGSAQVLKNISNPPNVELSSDPMRAPLCGFSLALAPNEACYVPLAHRQSGDGGLFAGDLVPDQIANSAALE